MSGIFILKNQAWGFEKGDDIWQITYGKGDQRMDLMIGTMDTKRLRKDLLHHYRTSGKSKSPVVRHQMDLVEMANEQQLVAIAREEGMDLRPYIR